MTIAAWTRAVCILATSLSLSGCISYQSQRERIDADIPDMRFLQEITLGETTSDWLLNQFGQPSVVRRPSDTVAVWQYENVERSMTRVRALPLFAVERNDLNRTAYLFEIENDYIVRYWQDDLD